MSNDGPCGGSMYIGIGTLIVIIILLVLIF